MNDSGFLDHLRELLASVPELRMRRMFGGHGIYSGDLMFALVDNDELYIKADEENRAAFLAEDCVPFVYQKQGKDMTISYYSVPASAFDAADEMMRWARLGIDAALRKAARSGS